MSNQNAVVYAGVDVAKASLQVDVQGRQREFKNTPSGLRQLCEELQKTSRIHVVCEATGGYEQPMVEALHEQKIPVTVTNPAHVRAAAQARGQRAKTAVINVRMLTEYGQLYLPETTPASTETQNELVRLTQWLQQ